MRNQKSLGVLAECAVMIALAAVLSEYAVIYKAPLGGAVTLFSMAPVIIIGLRHGCAWGFGTAFAYSLTQFMFDASKLSAWGVAGARSMIICALLDYIIAFTALGAAGFFCSAIDKAKKRGKKIAFAFAAVLLACVLRYMSHVAAGIMIWYAITKAGNWNEYVNTVGAWVYSLVYNAQYMLPETAITLVAAPAVVTVLAAVKKQKISKF
ncbi:MAG: energy-coupled thiamine transporter ThiT [Oscillospiraceae bacterium]|nr:energy-coupled thiamine transporter ThiT [Oscillospiraceae bacterium]